MRIRKRPPPLPSPHAHRSQLPLPSSPCISPMSRSASLPPRGDCLCPLHLHNAWLQPLHQLREANTGYPDFSQKIASDPRAAAAAESKPTHCCSVPEQEEVLDKTKQAGEEDHRQTSSLELSAKTAVEPGRNNATRRHQKRQRIIRAPSTRDWPNCYRSFPARPVSSDGNPESVENINASPVAALPQKAADYKVACMEPAARPKEVEHSYVAFSDPGLMSPIPELVNDRSTLQEEYGRRKEYKPKTGGIKMQDRQLDQEKSEEAEQRAAQDGEMSREIELGVMDTQDHQQTRQVESSTRKDRQELRSSWDKMKFVLGENLHQSAKDEDEATTLQKSARRSKNKRQRFKSLHEIVGHGRAGVASDEQHLQSSDQVLVESSSHALQSTSVKWRCVLNSDPTEWRLIDLL